VTATLIVNADDLGLTAGVCEAIETAHRNGIVTSTSLLAVGTAFDQAVTMLRRNPGLDLGAHLAIVGEDPPLLSAREIPTLVDRGGRFPLSYRTVVARGVARRIDPADVQREFAAQFERIGATGLAVTHLDTHQHTHLWPAVAQVVVDLARANGVPAVRIPASARRGLVGVGVNVLARKLRRKVLRGGLTSTARYAGLDEAGALDIARLHTALLRARSKAAPTLEINTHPGLADDHDLERFDWSYRWSDEFTMLTDPHSRELVASSGFRLASFADLANGPIHGGSSREGTTLEGTAP
jgi:predicted glycoside hydrolase/deacetylase ChbG (UPF0249 family)